MHVLVVFPFASIDLVLFIFESDKVFHIDTKIDLFAFEQKYIYIYESNQILSYRIVLD